MMKNEIKSLYVAFLKQNIKLCLIGGAKVSAGPMAHQRRILICKCSYCGMLRQYGIFR